MMQYVFDWDSCKRISDQDYNTLVKNGCKPEIGDILLSKDGTMGLSILFNDTKEIVLLSSIAIIRPKENFGSYLKTLLSQKENISRLIESHASGSALPRIVLKDLKQFKILIPNRNTLHKFDYWVTPILKTFFQNSQLICNVSKRRDFLLPKLMSGEIRT